ncbi:MAG: T9SS type B sorting domain-containing protein, partial [Bacteroidetes bacterium]
QFSINGTNISNPFTAPAATGVWDEFYAVWNSGVSTSATICIVNQNTSAGGNDFGLDDIFFANICSSTESVTITVNPPADATITPQSPICEDNGTITFSAAQSGGTWSGTGITNTSTGTFDPSVSGAGTFDITYTIPGSCGDQDMVQILVNALPTADAGADQVICAGEQVTLVGSGATTLAWSNSVQDGVAFTPSSTVTYTLTATDGNGCVDQDQVTVTVNPLPNVNAGLDQTVCDGANVTLSASGATSYTWSNGVVDGQSFTPTPGTTTYTVSGTDANGCVNSDDVDVNVFTYPVVDVNADVQVGYPTLQVNFNDLSSGGDTYFWDFGNGQTGVVSVPTNQTMSYGSVGTYTMELTISNGSCQVSDTIMITVIPFPAPLIHVPNIFTPNQDGSNDEFFIDTEFVSELNVLIINRWGNTVAEITTPQGVWDGTINGNAADDGVYFFRYEATGLNGDVLTGHGNITLVR